MSNPEPTPRPVAVETIDLRDLVIVSEPWNGASAIYVKGERVWESDSSDLGDELATRLHLDHRRVQVYYEDELPDSLDELMENDARVRRQVWHEAKGLFFDPETGFWWTEEGHHIEDEDEPIPDPAREPAGRPAGEEASRC